MANKTQLPSQSEPATVIGASVQIRGNVTGDEDLHVFGRVEGRIEIARGLVVGPGGIVKAEVEAKTAIISGILVGNVNATDSIEITKEGRVVGDLTAPRIIIVDGAGYRGSIDMGDVGQAPAKKASAERSRPAPPAPVSRPVEAARPTPARTVVSAPAAPSQTPRPAAAPSTLPSSVSMTPRPSSAPLEAPSAKGLPQKAQKTRVIVKRK